MKMHMPGRLVPTPNGPEWCRFEVRSDVKELLKGTTIHIEFIESGKSEKFVTQGRCGTHVKFPLKTKDPRLALDRRVKIRSYLQDYYNTVRAGEQSLTQRQIGELAREVYDKYIEIYGDDPAEVDVLQAVKAWNRAVAEKRETNPPGLNIFGGPDEDVRTARIVFGVDLTAGVNALTPGEDNRDAMERRFGDAATWVLSTRKSKIDAATRRELLIVVEKAASDVHRELIKRKRGDFSPDINQAKYPKYVPARELFTLDMLFDLWKPEKKMKMLKNMEPIVRSFKSIIGAKDVRDVDKRDIAKWRVALKARGDLEERTINESYLHMATTLFNVAIRDGIIEGANVFSGTKTSGRGHGRPKRERYTDEEVKRLLTIARLHETNVARRWIPWICACTGSRVGEVAQMYKESVKQDANGIWYFQLKADPDAHEKKLKTDNAYRNVPIHSALIQEGFLRFWETLPDGPIFYKEGRKTEKNSAHSLVAGSMAHWIRKIGFTDPKKSPNHAFRLWLRTAASDAHVDISFTRYMIGHDQGSVEAGYVDPDVDQLKRQIETIRIPVPD